MRILVTGASGFIGSHVTRLLVQKGHDVIILSRPASNTKRIHDVLQSTRTISGDLLKPSAWETQLEKLKPEMCFHLGWYVEPGKYLTSLLNLDYVEATLHLISALGRTGCKRFVSTGTCFEYNTSLPERLSEASPTKPQSLYAASKLGVSIISQQLTADLGMSFAWVRLFYQYGPYEDERRLMPFVICSLLRGKEVNLTQGEQVRDFLHVEDVASALVATAESKLDGAVNIGSGKPVTVAEIALQIGKNLGRPELIKLGALPYNSHDPMFVCANNARLVQNTGWQPSYDLGKGLDQTIDWWKKELKVKTA